MRTLQPVCAVVSEAGPAGSHAICSFRFAGGGGAALARWIRRGDGRGWAQLHRGCFGRWNGFRAVAGSLGRCFGDAGGVAATLAGYLRGCSAHSPPAARPRLQADCAVPLSHLGTAGKLPDSDSGGARTLSLTHSQAPRILLESWFPASRNAAKSDQLHPEKARTRARRTQSQASDLRRCGS